MCTCVCLPASLLPHTQAFLTQEGLGMSLSVSVRTLDILNHVTLHASVALMCGGVTLEAGWTFTDLQGCSQLKVSKKSSG